MELTIAPNGVLQIDDARIIFRNFAGKEDKYNREGDRNFALLIPDREIADQLVDEGWNVKIKPGRDEDDDEFIYLPVTVKFNDRGPNCYLISGRAERRLTEESVGIIDDIDISSVNLDIRPYDWEVNGKTGRKAYLSSIEVFQEIDRFGAKYQNRDEEYGK